MPAITSGTAMYQAPLSCSPRNGSTEIADEQHQLDRARPPPTPTTRELTTVAVDTGASRSRRSSFFSRQVISVSAAPNTAPTAMP